MNRYGYYTINSSLEDVWNRTFEFFEKYKCKIKDQHLSPNRLYRKLIIRHSFSMHIYGTSSGETYEMTFGYNPSDDNTYVSVSVKYSNFGKGVPSKVPKDMMKEWAYEMGITLNKIKELSQNQIVNLSNVFCAMCGEKNSKTAKFCVYCGSQLDN